MPLDSPACCNRELVWFPLPPDQRETGTCPRRPAIGIDELPPMTATLILRDCKRWHGSNMSIIPSAPSLNVGFSHPHDNSYPSKEGSQL